MRARSWTLLLFACCMLVAALGPVMAQTRLFPGASVQGSISSDTASTEYSFDAVAGDRIRARALGLNGLDVALSITDANGEALASGNSDLWSPDPTDGFVAVTIPVDGAYSVVVGGQSGTSGDYLLQFLQNGANEPLNLPFNQTTIVPVIKDSGSLWLDFEADPDCPTVMVVHPLVDEAEYFGYFINVFDSSGAQVGQVTVDRPVESRLEFAAGSGRYWAEVKPWKSQRDGELLVTITCAVGAPACMEYELAVPDDEPPAEIPPGLFSARAGGELSYGEALAGDVAQGSAFRLYQFNAEEGDDLALQVTGISFDFNPEVYLFSPSQELIRLAKDSIGAFKDNDATLALIAPETGTYQAYVASEDQQAGAYVIRLVGDPAEDPIELPFEVPVVVSPSQFEGLDKPLLRYNFEAQPDCSTMVSLFGNGADALSLGSFVRRDEGDPVGRLRVSDVTSAALVVPAATGWYDVFLAPPDDFDALDPLTLLVTCQKDSDICKAVAGNEPLTPVSLPEVTPVPTTAIQCGNGTCDGGWEDEFSCPGDCDICGNGICGPFESFDSCQIDCPFRPTATTPPISTPIPGPTQAAVCGNGWCEGDEAGTCCSDCGTCGGAVSTPTATPPVCNFNLQCEPGENAQNCRNDCPICGDNLCETFLGEDENNCPADCQEF